MAQVSVIIPMYNNGATIGRAIKSVLRQTVQDFEIIVCDDFSSDNSVNIVQNINDARIRLIKSETHTNANVCRNRAIMAATGLYVAFLDADDWWAENHLARMLNLLHESGADGAYGVPMFPDDATSPVYVRRRPGESMIDYLLRAPYNAQTSTLVLKTNTVRAVMFDETLLRHQDYDFLCRYDKKFRLVGDAVPSVFYAITPKKFNPELMKSCITCMERHSGDITRHAGVVGYATAMLRLCKNDEDRRFFIRMREKYSRNLINVIEIDSHNLGLQSGIERYINILDAYLPPNVNIFKIIFYQGPNIREIRIRHIPGELQVFHPIGIPIATLVGLAMSMAGPILDDMDNLIVKCNCLGTESMALAVRARVHCRLVGVLHCLPHRSARNAAARQKNPNAAIFPQINSWRAFDHIILVCDTGREWLAGVKNKLPYTVIRNGIPPVQAAQPHDDGVFRFIFPGGFASHKGFDKIIPAIRMVAAKYKIQVIVMGGGTVPEKDITDLPIIRTGLLNDDAAVNECWGNADCALFASVSEACSFAGIEAMAHNLPIVSTTAVGLVEMFGRGALFVKMSPTGEIDAAEYAAAMMRIIENKSLRVKLGAVAYARYLAHYTAHRMTRETYKLYKKLLSI